VKLRILGCGTSFGVPRIGNDWGKCDPAEPRNRRRRVSILVEHEDVRVLVDTGPDLREQLLDADVHRLDAVIWTHDHADHTHGIDDLRALVVGRNAPIRGYAREKTLDSLRTRFAYAFEGANGYSSVIQGAVMPDRLTIGGIEIRAVDQPHGSITSAGLRFEAGGRSIGYATDCHEMTEEMAAMFDRLDVWVVDALRRKPHPSHPHVDRALDWVSKVRPSRSILTHMDNSLDYQTLLAELPETVEPGYDGLEISL
jgi:phosphoribosyl 1,2-cyclic phosphate phosphodiesterase